MPHSPTRGLLCGLLGLFSLGVLGTSTRACVRSFCTSRLAFVVAAGAVSAAAALALALGQLFAPGAAAPLEVPAALLLLAWWAAAVGVATVVGETLRAPFARPVLGLAWACVALAFALAYASLAELLAPPPPPSARDGGGGGGTIPPGIPASIARGAGLHMEEDQTDEGVKMARVVDPHYALDPNSTRALPGGPDDAV